MAHGYLEAVFNRLPKKAPTMVLINRASCDAVVSSLNPLGPRATLGELRLYISINILFSFV